MDARKHLRGLGWKGEGHALGKNANGIKKPILISHKRGLHGLGAKSQKEKQADQWWLNAFDNALKDIGSGKESALSQIRDNGAKNSLYRFFVRGVGLEGTIDDSSSGTSTPAEASCVQSTSTTILSVQDLPADASAQGPKPKKEKKPTKEKKRKRDEDPVDSHQDEPAIQKSSCADEAVTKPKKSKKKRSKTTTPEVEEEAVENVTPPIEPMNDAVAPTATGNTDKEARRKARKEKRARKEERRLRREKEAVSDSSIPPHKKEKKAKKSKSSTSIQDTG